MDTGRWSGRWPLLFFNWLTMKYGKEDVTVRGMHGLWSFRSGCDWQQKIILKGVFQAWVRFLVYCEKILPEGTFFFVFNFDTIFFYIPLVANSRQASLVSYFGGCTWGV